MAWLVDALFRRLAISVAADFDEACELLATGDIVAEPFGGNRAAIVVEGRLNRLFAWTMASSGRPTLIDLDEFVANVGNLVVVRRLIDHTHRSDADVERFGDAMAAIIEQTLHDGGDALTRECGRAGSSGPRLVVYSYMRLELLDSSKPLALFDREDVLIDGDLDCVLDSTRFELTRDAFVLRAHQSRDFDE